MENKALRVYLQDEKKSKVLALRKNDHFEMKFDYSKMVELRNNGWFIYAINEEGVFLFLANCDFDGNDWCKITIKDFK